MEIRHLRAFIAVADTKSVRRAAGELRVAPSALSRTIRDLERDLGVTLLVRSSRGARLTKGGERFLDGARRILAEANAAIAMARDARTSGAGPLVIGVIQPELRPVWIQTAVRRYRKAMPDVAIHLESMGSVAMAEAATRRAIDIGIGYALAPSHGIVVETIMEDVLGGVIVARAHPLARRRTVSIFDLQPYPFLWGDRAANPTMFDRIFAAFRHVGFVPQFIPAFGEACASAWPCFTLVGSGFGWGIYPSMARPALPSTMRYIPLTDLSIPLHIDLLTRADDRSSRTRAFSRILEELAADASLERVRVLATR